VSIEGFWWVRARETIEERRILGCWCGNCLFN